MRALSKKRSLQMKNSVRIYCYCIIVNKVISNDLASLGKQRIKRKLSRH